MQQQRKEEEGSDQGWSILFISLSLRAARRQRCGGEVRDGHPVGAAPRE